MQEAQEEKIEYENATQLDVFGVVGDVFDPTNTTENVAKRLKNMPSDKPIEVRIDSPGGDVQNGFAIAALLADAPQRVEVNIVGWAASIASIIALAGDNVVMDQGGFFMIHKPSAGLWGESNDLRQTADFLDKIESNLIDVYVQAIEDRGKLIDGDKEKTRNQVAEWVATETWFTASEALEVGFIDAIKKKEEASAMTDNVNVQNFTKRFFNKAPKRAPKSLEMAETKKGFFARFMSWLKNDAEAAQELQEALLEKPEDVQEEKPTQEEIELAKTVLEKAGILEAPIEEEEKVEEKEEEKEEEVEETLAEIEARIRKEIEQEQKAKIENQIKQRLAEAKAGAPSSTNSSQATKPANRKLSRKEKIAAAAASIVAKNKEGWNTFTSSIKDGMN